MVLPRQHPWCGFRGTADISSWLGCEQFPFLVWCCHPSFLPLHLNWASFLQELQSSLFAPRRILPGHTTLFELLISAPREYCYRGSLCIIDTSSWGSWFVWSEEYLLNPNEILLGMKSRQLLYGPLLLFGCTFHISSTSCGNIRCITNCLPPTSVLHLSWFAHCIAFSCGIWCHSCCTSRIRLLAVLDTTHIAQAQGFSLHLRLVLGVARL